MKSKIPSNPRVRLVLAAPELLSSAKRAAADLENILPEFDPHATHDGWETIDLLKDAIAVAEGRAGVAYPEPQESSPCYLESDTQRKLLEDLLSFLLFTYRRNDMDDTRKLKSIVDTLAHDINGTLDGDEFFSPRVSGYSEKFPVL